MKFHPLVALVFWGWLIMPSVQGAPEPVSQKGVSITLSTSDRDNVFLPAEEKKVIVRIGNSRPDPVSLTVELEGQADLGAVQKLSRAVTVPAGSRVEESFLLNLPGPCFVIVKVRAMESGRKVGAAETTLSVVRPQPLKSVSFQKAFYGFSFFANPETSSRIGGRFIRTMAFWKWTNPNPGEYNFSIAADLGRRAHSSGVGMIYTLVLAMRPAWTGLEDVGDLVQPVKLKLYDQWVQAAMERLPAGDYAIEIDNEPDLELGKSQKLSRDQAAGLGAKLVTHAVPIIRAKSGDIPVLAAGVSGVDFHNQLSFSRRILSDATGLADYFSPHPYTEARLLRGSEGESMSAEVDWPDSYDLVGWLQQSTELARKHVRGKAVWSTELGWAVKGEETGLSSSTRDWAAITAQVLILFKTVPGVEKFAFFAGQVKWLERGYNYSIFLKDESADAAGGRWKPLPPVNAYATVTSLLEGSATGRKLDLGPSMRGYMFSNHATGQSVAALWAVRHDVSFSGEWPIAAALVDLYGRESRPAAKLPVSFTRAPLFVVVPLAAEGDLLKALQGAKWIPERAFSIVAVGAESSGQMILTVESLLQDSLNVRISVGNETVNMPLKPGRNTVPVKLPSGVIAAPGIDTSIRVETATGSTSTQIRRDIVEAPYVANGAWKVDGAISSQERSWLKYELKTRDKVLPPDPAVSWDGPEDLSVRYGYAWNEEGLYFLAVVRDDISVPVPAGERQLWNYDSLQIAFSTGSGKPSSSGYGPGDRELVMALPSSGETTAYQTHPLRSDPVEYPARVSRHEGETVYELFLPWSYFWGNRTKELDNAVLAVNFIVNDNDGNGRGYWMGPADGIASGKKPNQFPWLRLLPRPQSPTIESKK